MTEAILTAARTADAEESVPRSAGALAHIVTIAKRELVSYFESPIAYVFIVIFLLLVGFFTFMVSGFFERGEANLEPFFAWHLWLYLFLVPAIAIDQFVLRGGRLLAFLDPKAVLDRSGEGMGAMGSASGLDKLLKAWGGLRFILLPEQQKSWRISRGRRST